MYVKFGGVRAAVEEGFDKYLLVPYDRVFKNSENRFLRGFATSIDEATKSGEFTRRERKIHERHSHPVCLPHPMLLQCPGNLSTVLVPPLAPWPP